LQGQEDLQAHQANLSIGANVGPKGHCIIDGDRLEQRLASIRWCGYRLAGVHDDGWSSALLLCWWRVGSHLSLGVEPKIVDGIDVEQLIPTPTGPDLPLNALRVWVGEKHLACLMVAELIQCVGQHQVVVETIFTEREALHPFHGEEWSEKLRNPPYLAC
jgi:hypothetical protein